MIGQEILHRRAMIVMVDEDGQVHAWDVGVGRSTWEWTGTNLDGRSTAKVTMNGTLHRRTRDLDQFATEMGELE